MRDDDRERLQQFRQQLDTTTPDAHPMPADPIERLLRDLRQDPEIARVFFTANFLNDAGYVLERDGFGAAEAYLLDRAERQDLAPQARFVLYNVLPRLRACPPVVARRSLGRYVVKVLPTLKRRGR